MGKEGSMAHEHVENDLDHLKGIGPKYKTMLKEIGVDSIKDCATAIGAPEGDD
jgi:predicted flap endonuclease-1-like 5' DNA nuclease